MNLQLKNDATGEVREVKNGAALYFLFTFIPLIGGILLLVMTIVRKQFKVWLNYAILGIVIFIIYLILIGIFANVGILVLILSILIIAVFIYMFVSIIMNLNYWSYNKYIEDGYKVENPSDTGVQEFIERAQEKTRPFWLFLI